MMDFRVIRAADPEVAQAMEAELARQRDAYRTDRVGKLCESRRSGGHGFSHLTNKYAEGYPGKRYYGGCECVDVVENLARDRACQLFGAEHANVQPHSGAQANIAVYFAPAGARRYHPGHEPLPRRPSDARQPREPVRQVLPTSCPTAFPKRTSASITTRCADLALEHKPKLIVAGASRPIRATIDFANASARSPRRSARCFMVDMAHIAGLVAAGVHPEPRALCRRRDHHHAQDPARPARRHDPLPQGSMPRPSTKASSPARRAAR